MKKLTYILSFFAAALVVFAGCRKVDPLPYYNDGSKVNVTVSRTAVAPAPADSTTNVLTVSWTSPNYGTNPATYKFIVEIDSANGNFAEPFRREVIGQTETSFTGRDLNALLLNYGYRTGVATPMKVRVVSSYSNNNERQVSNPVTVNVTAFTDPSVLTSSATTVTGTMATASQTAATFNWTRSFVGYTGTITYSIQYDSAGKNFASPGEIAVGNNMLTRALTQAEVNSAALAEGVAAGSAGRIEFRVKATTAQGALAFSNAVPIQVTTFAPVPANLYIVGDATPGGWSNPVAVPSQQFTKIDANTFAITIGLNAGGSYLFLPVNGSWDSKYGGATNGMEAGGGILLKDGAVPGSNTPAPGVSGVYRIVVNFQTNRYTVTKITVPANLYIVGDATPGGWSNPVAVPSQQFTKIDDATFGIIINLTAGNSYLFLPVNGSWDSKYGGATNGTAAGGGVLLKDGDVPGSNTPAPGTSGLYKIIVNFSTNSYTVTPYDGPTDLYIVGDATPGGWANPVPVPSQKFTKTGNGEFELTLPLTAGGSYLFLPVNGSWDSKYGGATNGTAAGGGMLLKDGAVPGSNTPAPATSGNYKIVVSFLTNTYKVIKQ